MNNFELVALMKEYFKEILSVLGAVGMFFLGKRKRNQTHKEKDVQILGGELENVEAALKIYRGMLEDLHTKLTEAEKAYTLLEGRFQIAIKRNKDFENQVNMLTSENKYLLDKINKLSKNESRSNS